MPTDVNQHAKAIARAATSTASRDQRGEILAVVTELEASLVEVVPASRTQSD